ncbi:MAG: glutamate--tRNA ligase [Solirubrobacterales bacterium]
MPVRARFAPSPTGPLHVGSARTALLNWLFVRHSSGRLLLRIDDTDRERSTTAFEDAILSDLRWLGLDWDDGPVHQSDRSARYAEVLAELPTVDRDGAFEFEGRVIARADGSALYHLATAVDDIDDAISHVLRGRDHVANTELQSAIIRALGAEPPAYVHAPLLVFEGGAKISKREEAEGGAVTIAALRDQGFLPGAICNALALSLADFGVEEIVLDLAELASRFDLERLHTADSHFDDEKLRWVNGQHIRALDESALRGYLAEFGAAELPDAAVEAARTAGATLTECAEAARWLVDPPEPDDQARELAATPEAASALRLLLEIAPEPAESVAAAEEIFEQLKTAIRDSGASLGPSLRGLRSLLTGRAHGPEFPFVLATLSAERFAAALAAAGLSA